MDIKYPRPSNLGAAIHNTKIGENGRLEVYNLLTSKFQQLHQKHSRLQLTITCPLTKLKPAHPWTEDMTQVQVWCPQGKTCLPTACAPEHLQPAEEPTQHS